MFGPVSLIYGFSSFCITAANLIDSGFTSALVTIGICGMVYSCVLGLNAAIDTV